MTYGGKAKRNIGSIFLVVGVSRVHVTLPAVGRVKTSGSTQSACVLLMDLIFRLLLSISLMMQFFGCEKKYEWSWWKFENYVCVSPFGRVVQIPRPCTQRTLLPLCPPHPLLRSITRRRYRSVLANCQSTSSLEVSILPASAELTAIMSFRCNTSKSQLSI